MIDGFYLFIHERLESFIYSDVIPRTNDVIEYNDCLYTVVTIRYDITQEKIIGDATVRKKVTACKVYVII